MNGGLNPLEAISLVKDKRRRNRGLFVFFISFILAFIFWLLFAFNETHTASLLLPVDYINFPEDKILKKALPEQMQLRIEANGWDIINLKKSPESYPIVIDIQNYIDAGQIITSGLAGKIEFRQIKDLKVLGIFPDIINVEFEKMAFKEVPIIAHTDIKYEKQFGIAGKIIVEPSKVTITGPESDVKSVGYLKTNTLEEGRVSSDLTKMVGIVLPESMNIRSNISHVKVTVPVDKYTEGHFTLPVKILNDDSDSIILIPENVDISFRTAIRNFPQIDMNDFSAYVKGSEIVPGEYRRLKVYHTKKNEFVFSVKTDPEYLDYVIKKSYD